MSGNHQEPPEKKQSRDDALESSADSDSAAGDFAAERRRIHRSRSRLMVCFYTLPLYIAALILLLNGGRGITLLMFVYMVVYAVFAVDMVLRECPRCGKQFFVNALLLNFFARRCVHCGLSCRPEKTSDQPTHGRHF